MDREVTLGIICGIVFGIVSVLMMIPLPFADKRSAMLGAFCNRFAIGFVVGTVQLPMPDWGRGLLFGFLLSLPDAIITKAWKPILGMGAVGGVIIGLIVGH